MAAEAAAAMANAAAAAAAAYIQQGGPGVHQAGGLAIEQVHFHSLNLG